MGTSFPKKHENTAKSKNFPDSFRKIDTKFLCNLFAIKLELDKMLILFEISRLSTAGGLSVRVGVCVVCVLVITGVDKQRFLKHASPSQNPV